MKCKLLLLVITFMFSTGYGWQDIIVTLSGNTLEGLTDEFQPATFSYKTRQLSVGTNSVVIPGFLWERIFENSQPEDLSFSAGLHREEGFIAPYLCIYSGKWRLVIDLDTLQLEDIYDRERNFYYLTQDQLSQWVVNKKSSR